MGIFPSSFNKRSRLFFLLFLSDLLSSDKKIEISSPYNPVHLTHVGYNLDTGEFTVSTFVESRGLTVSRPNGLEGASNNTSKKKKKKADVCAVLFKNDVPCRAYPRNGSSYCRNLESLNRIRPPIHRQS